MFGFSWVCFSEEAPGWQGGAMAGHAGSLGARSISFPLARQSRFLAFSLPCPLFGQPSHRAAPSLLSRQKGKANGLQPQQRLRFHQAVLVSLTALSSFRRSQRPKCVFFDNYLRSSAVICHNQCLLPSLLVLSQVQYLPSYNDFVPSIYYCS